MLVYFSAGSSTVLPPVPGWYCTWAWFSKEVLSGTMQVSLQLMRQTGCALHVRHDMISDHIGVTTVERPDPKDLFTLVSAWSSRHTGDSNSCPPDLELGVLTKWLASRMLV
jgi:hypothetical protein